MRVLVKGSPEVACREALRRGIQLMNPFRSTVLTETVADVRQCDVPKVVRWYCEPGQLKAQVGYADGTLLYYSGK